MTIEGLEAKANERGGVTIYNIAHRNAGWGVQWYEPHRALNSENPDNYKNGLVVYRYYQTPEEMISAEAERLDTA